eukprot:10581325-Prorocentrum_lima.AAC.1
MTSSLVGSEMCIRDRVPGAPEEYITGKKTKVEYFVHSLTGQRAVQPPFEQTYFCLLYTSDAADDM